MIPLVVASERGVAQTVSFGRRGCRTGAQELPIGRIAEGAWKGPPQGVRAP
jgi:hypothetical protein